MNVTPTEIPGDKIEDLYLVGLRRLFVALGLLLASVASAADLNFYELFDMGDSVSENDMKVQGPEALPVKPITISPVGKQAAKPVVKPAVKSAVKPVVKSAIKPVEKSVEKPVVKVVEKIVTVEKPVTNVIEKIVTVEKPVEKIVTVEKPVEKIVTVEKPITNVVEKVVVTVVTNVVERQVRDLSVEKRLLDERDRASLTAGRFEAKNLELSDRNEELQSALEAERARNQELTKALTPAQKKALESRPAKITAASTYYDSKDGVAFFSGHVYVDDAQYQLHSDKAYVFMDKEGTNELKRIVALGNVAITNDTKRAYGAKASYYREAGMVVLYAPEGGMCEVRDEKEYPPQTVTGTKIKFWVGSEQVEVTGARISAPVTSSGTEAIKHTMGGGK